MQIYSKKAIQIHKHQNAISMNLYTSNTISISMYYSINENLNFRQELNALADNI